MTNSIRKISLSQAALFAGLAYIMMMVTPYAEFYALPKLIIPGKIDETIKNIMANEALFRTAIVGYLLAFIGDLIAAWALYILLKPVNESLSLLTALFRLVYTILSLVALLSLVAVQRLLSSAENQAVMKPDQVSVLAGLLLSAFRNYWSFAYIFFGIHLVLLGYLVFRSGYIPRIIGVLLMIAGIGWMADNLRPLLFPGLHINFTLIIIAGLGELVFMFWLLIRGSRISDSV